MTSASATSARNCPVCGSPNSGLSLFCAECGAALNGSSESDTTAFRTSRPDNDSQPTQSFVPAPSHEAPAPSESGRWQVPGATSTTALPPTQGADPKPWRSPSSGPTSSAVSTNAWPAAGEPVAVQFVPADDGIRGFVLGFLAIALIAALLGLYLWAGVLSDNTRDTISGWFDFINF